MAKEVFAMRGPAPRCPSGLHGIDDCAAQRRAIRTGRIGFRGLTHGHYPGDRLPPSVLPGLSSLGFLDAMENQDWGMKPHRNEGLEISFLETGRMNFMVDGALHPMASGSFSVTRPWQLHCHGMPRLGPGRLHWLILDTGARRPSDAWRWPEWIVLRPEDLRRLVGRLRARRASTGMATPMMAAAFREIARSLSEKDPRRRISQIILGVNQVLLDLEALLDEPAAPKPPPISTAAAVERFLGELARDPALLGEAWTLPALARRCGVGLTALVRHCHACANTTPMDYLNRCRLAWAAAQFRQGSAASITEISFRCGFSSASYFSTQFRRSYRMSPSAYRRAAAL